jgi:hypothetical protein
VQLLAFHPSYAGMNNQQHKTIVSGVSLLQFLQHSGEIDEGRARCLQRFVLHFTSKSLGERCTPGSSIQFMYFLHKQVNTWVNIMRKNYIDGEKEHLQN